MNLVFDGGGLKATGNLTIHGTAGNVTAAGGGGPNSRDAQQIPTQFQHTSNEIITAARLTNFLKWP